MRLILLVTLLVSHFGLLSPAFAFHFTSPPTQCSNLTVQWVGGQAPFTLLLVPTGHLSPETRKIIQKDVPSGNSVSFVLNYPADSQFVAILNDAGGIGAGGTSQITTVASSSDSSCLSTTQSEPKFFLYLPNDIGQCDSIDFSWGSQAQPPVDVLGVIPAGQSFEVANITDSSTSFDWTANVRSGTQIMFVAGDKDGFGSGGSSDVMQIGEGNNDNCIDDSSPSSTSGDAAGGVSSTTQGQSETQTSNESGMGSSAVVTTDVAGSTVTVGGTVTTDGFGSTYTIVGSTGVITTTDDAGSTVTLGGSTPIVTTDSSGSTFTIAGNPSNFPGSGGGTVTGSSDNRSGGSHKRLGLILGLLFGLLGLGLIIGGTILYRRRAAGRAYSNLETGASSMSHPHPWVTALSRGAHIRGGADSSVDTLPSMYQTEPFILPSEHEPYSISRPQEPPPARQQRPGLSTQASSTRSISSLLGEGPFTRDAFGGALAGVHGPDREDSVGPHGQPPNRTPSGRAVTQRNVPPPTTVELPIRVTRDSEDFSPEPEEMSPNPYDDPVVEIPPTYASVRRASRSNDREPWRPARANLTRSNASRRSRSSMFSNAGIASNETSDT